MSIRLQDINTTNVLNLTDKLLVSNGSSENLVSVETFIGHTNLLFEGASTTSATLTGNANMYKYTLTNNGLEVPSGASGMSIASGGVQVSAAGAYKVTASLYLSNNSSRTGVYVFYGSSFTDGPAADTGATELCGVYSETGASANKQVTGIVTNVPANTIFFLVGRAATSNAPISNGWLLVERLA